MELRWSSVLVDAYSHSSAYLIATVAVTVGSVLFVWLYEKPSVRRFFTKNVSRNISQADMSNESESAEAMTEEEYLTSARSVSTKSLVEQISAEMTLEQREREREIEKEQLQAIFSLLQEQKDKFNVASMEQLEEQLNLYR